jgi:inosine-uridine nucleoside N-ribohydrolase
MIRWTFLATIAFAVLGASWTPIASAQSPDAPAIEPQQQASSHSDTELKSFALAAINVVRIRDLYLPKLESAETPEQEQEVRKAAADEMVQAIESEGMTVGRYTEISKQARESPEIAKRVQEHVRDATK